MNIRFYCHSSVITNELIENAFHRFVTGQSLYLDGYLVNKSENKLVIEKISDFSFIDDRTNKRFYFDKNRQLINSDIFHCIICPSGLDLNNDLINSIFKSHPKAEAIIYKGKWIIKFKNEYVHRSLFSGFRCIDVQRGKYLIWQDNKFVEKIKIE